MVFLLTALLPQRATRSAQQCVGSGGFMAPFNPGIYKGLAQALQVLNQKRSDIKEVFSPAEAVA